MKKRIWNKAILGALLTTSIAAPIALAQSTDSINPTLSSQVQLVDYWREGGKRWGYHKDERRRGKYRHQGRENPWKMNGFQRGSRPITLRILHMQEDLNLSEEQINRLEEATQQSQQEMIKLRSQRKLLQLDQHQLMRQETFNQAAMQNHNQQMVELHLQMANLRTTEISTAHQVLTPAQWKQWQVQQSSQKRGNHWRHHKDERHRGKYQHQGKHGETKNKTQNDAPEDFLLNLRKPV